jgi:hypothetical protein
LRGENEMSKKKNIKKNEKNNEQGWLFDYKTYIDPETGDLKEVKVLNPEKNVGVYDKDALEKKKEIERQEEYMFLHNRFKKEAFTQMLLSFDQKIVGKYHAKKLASLMRLLPLTNYSNKKDEDDKVLMIQSKKATATMLYKYMKVDNKTGKKYLEEFVADGIYELVEDEDDKRYTYYRSTGKVFLRGEKGENEFSKKVVMERFLQLIEEIDKEVESEKKRKKKNFIEIHPLALFGALASKVHYKTFFFLKNNTEELIKEDETVREVLKSTHKIRRLKFLKQYEIWQMYSGQKLKKLTDDETDILDRCFEILFKTHAIGSWRGGKKPLLIMNPKLVYVSPKEKFDSDWKDIIQTLFGLSEVLDKDENEEKKRG